MFVSTTVLSLTPILPRYTREGDKNFLVPKDAHDSLSLSLSLSIYLLVTVRKSTAIFPITHTHTQ